MTGVSFVVPVHNGGAYLAETLSSIVAQADGRPFEIIVVDDHSSDVPPAVVAATVKACPLRVLRGPGRGAPAAVNAGIRAATMPYICQVDQDVVLEPGWMSHLVAALDDPRVGAAQGYYATGREGSFLPRVMGLDLELRYAAVGRQTDHVCTGNSAYRRDALAAVGLFDETLGYGYDNDLSYRLESAGYRLAFCRDARSRHRWREGLLGYVTQQYGFGYGRLDLLTRHPTRYRGDAVSPALMMAHPALMGVALVLVLAAALSSVLGGSVTPMIWAAAAVMTALVVERAIAGIRAWQRFGDPAALAFPVVHLIRDLAWVNASIVWLARRLLRRPSRPEHSMRARPTPQ